MSYDILIETILKTYQDKIFIRSEGKNLTYKMFSQQAQSLLHVLILEHGLKAGDKVSICLTDRLNALIAYFACLLGGLTMIPINKDLHEHEITYIIDLVKPDIQINDTFLFPKILTDSNITVQINPNNTNAIFFTSGTTNLPKGVCHTYDALFGNAKAFNQLTQLNDHLIMLHVMPIGYMAGILNTFLSPFVAGGTIVLAPQFSAQSAMNFWEPAISGNANCAWMSPTMLNLVAKLTRNTDTFEWTKNHIKKVFVGTAALSSDIKKEFESKFHTDCYESYGMTELMLVSVHKQKINNLSGNVGTLLPKISISIGNEMLLENGYTLSIQSPYMMLGYLRSDGTTGIIEEFLDTGDIGYEKNRILHILGREKDLIIHGGTNISPKVIEDMMLTLSQIQEVAIVGIPHPFWGEEIIACVVLSKHTQNEKEILKAIEIECKKNLSASSCPTKYIALSELPKSSTGKISKNKLKQII